MQLNHALLNIVATFQNRQLTKRFWLAPTRQSQSSEILENILTSECSIGKCQQGARPTFSFEKLLAPSDLINGIKKNISLLYR